MPGSEDAAAVTSDRTTRWRWSLLGLFGVVAAAGVIALVSRANLAPLMSGDSDEPVYVYQARMLAQGHVTLAARTHALFFHPWLFGQHGDRLFSQYQPGWPSVIAFAHVLGDERVALVLAAVAVVAATWFLAEQLARGTGVFAALLLLISPIFVVHAGLYLSYLWTAALVTAGLGCIVAAVQRGRPLVFVAGGALFGVAVMTRPLDAFIVAVLAALYAVVTLWKDKAALGRAAWWTGLGGLPFLLVAAVYNLALTGSVLTFPLQAAESRDTFGFGVRAMAAHTKSVDYTRHLAWDSLVKNASSVPHWFAGGGIGFLLVVFAVVLHRRQRETWLLVAAILVFPAAYFFWWATSLAAEGAAHGLGPHYYIPAFTFLAVLGARAIQDLVRRSRVVAGIAAVLVIAGSLLVLPSVLDNAHVTTELQRPAARPLLASDLRNAVVVMRADPSQYTLFGYGFTVGDPRLTGRVLYAVDRGPASADLARQYPNRKLYQFVQRTEPGHALLKPSYIVEPMQVLTGDSVRLHFTAKNPGHAPFIVATLKVDGHAVAKETLDSRAGAGRVSDFDVVLGTPTAPLPEPKPGLLTGRVADDGRVEVDVAFGPDANGDRGADVYARRYYVSSGAGGLAVQVPGQQYHRFDFAKVVWVRQNVDAQLSESPG